MKKVVMAVFAVVALAIPAGALAENGGNQTSSPTNGSSASGGSNTASQGVMLVQSATPTSSDAVYLTVTGGNGTNSSTNSPSADGANTATGGAAGAATTGTDSISMASGGDSSTSADQGNSAGQHAAGNGGSGGDAGFVAVEVNNPTSASNDASVDQHLSQKIIVVAPAVQKASAHFNDVLVALLGGIG